jgi:uncharacterized protein (TIGR04222 family)
MGTELRPTEAAYLTGGPRRAVLAALVVLRRGSAVNAGQPGTIKRTGEPPSGSDPVTRAIVSSLSTPIGSRMIRRRISVDKALMAMRKRLVTAKLLLPLWRRLLVPTVLFGLSAVMVATQPWAAGGAAALALAATRWPRCTRAGRRAVRELRRAYPVPDADADPMPAWDTGMVVAVHGELELPGIAAFARRARLRTGGVWPDRSATDATNTNESWTRGAY